MSRICITAKGKDLDSFVDPRFARCQNFLIIDSETGILECIENTDAETKSGAGIAAGSLMANNNVKVVLTGNVGPNAFQALKTAEITVITGVEGSVSDVIKKFKAGEFSETESFTVASHFGSGNAG